MKQLLYSHNLSTAVVCFIHNGFSFCFANSASLHQAEVTHEQRSSIPADSPTDSCRLSNLKVLCAGIRLHLPGIDCKTGHINFLSRCLPLEELAQSCTNWPFKLFSQTLVFFRGPPCSHTPCSSVDLCTTPEQFPSKAGCPLAHPHQPQMQVVWGCTQQYLQKTSRKIGVRLPIHGVDAEQLCHQDLLRKVLVKLEPGKRHLELEMASGGHQQGVWA